MKPVTPEVRSGFTDRIRQTIDEQKAVLEKIREGKPLEAENDDQRKVAYLQKRLNVDKGLIEEIASYKDPENLPLTEVQRSKAESLQGSTVDFMNIFFLDIGRAASKCIARVTLGNGEALGTGFMVSPTLFLTNHHVIEDESQAEEYILEFNYELDYQQKLLPDTRFRLSPGRFFMTSTEDDLDFTLVAIGEKISGPLELKDIGYLPLINSDDKHIKATFLNCIQHPNGDPKQVVIRENRLLARTNNTLIYSSDTMPGSSGSPVFNDSWEVVALHHYGEPYRAVVDNPAGLPKNGNEGIRISSIMNHLASRSSELNGAQASLLEEALNNRLRFPTPMLEQKESLPLTIKSIDMQNGNNNPQQPNAGGVITFTVPLTITVQLGNMVQQVTPKYIDDSDVQTKVKEETLSGAEKLVPDSNYSNRKGYNPNFLGEAIPLPQLSEEQRQLAAINKRAKAGDDEAEFKYEHFTVVMNAKRRVAFFTAVNIDGAKVVKINRQTGKVTRGPEALDVEDDGDGREAREVWYDDPRIDEAEVCHDDVYKDPEMRHFQRGHLVKRTDPSWGEVPVAVKGQADTFHFLNCSPQHEQFNPNAKRWAGVENWITKTSDDENIKVSVFSGPVFSAKDPVFAGLKVPKAFWKVIAWSENGELKATAIIADQSMLLKKPGGGERLAEGGLDQVPGTLPQEYHCSIEQIESMTGLDFGDLKQYDIYQGAESIFRMKPIDTFEHIMVREKKRAAAAK